MHIRNGVALILILLALISCGGSSRLVVDDPVPGSNDNIAGQPQQQVDTNPDVQTIERNTLTTSMPAIGSLQPGDTFDYVIRGDFIDEVFQFSSRVQFDNSMVRPIEVNRGDMVPGGAVFFNTLDQDGFVPVAITPLPNREAIGSGSGELARIRFEVISNTGGNSRISLENSAKRLQLRSRDGGRLSFDLRAEVGDAN